MSILTSFAYIGPGAGFAFLGSTFVFFLSIGLMVVSVLFWPIQWSLLRLRRRKLVGKAKANRVLIVGLDGLEPTLVDRYMGEGLLPNMKKLSEMGSYSRLGTTLPALSPVAWSTFQTGVNPGAHNIFDFLSRDKRHCLPLLSSTTTEVTRREIGFGRFKYSWVKPSIKILRGSQPFWRLLGRYGIFSNILRVPISYPPEKCFGNVLSAMCTPDLRGSQGTFSFFSSEAAGETATNDGTTGGEKEALTKKDGAWTGELKGPEVDGKHLLAAFSLTPKGGDAVEMQLGEQRHELRLNQFSPWIEITFRHGRRAISGISRFCLRALTPEIQLYVSPININPEKPALPIGAPIFFPQWLAKRMGVFGTLGLMEDTWGRNEHALDDQRFLDQTYLAHEERERMFFDVLERTREGLCVCVFDASDRIQHMFWRYLDGKHPSPCEDAQFSDTIQKMYQRMDELVGRVLQKLRSDDLLIVLSDHGFASFRRGINLNTWLMQEGYLALKEGTKPEGDYFKNVDWSRTKAFAVGLTGIFLNRKGREFQGILDEQQAQQIKAEISAKLCALNDPKDGAQAIVRMYDSAKEYKGLYVREAPDLIVGYAPGYRVSWDSVTGGFEPEVFSDNVKAWSGDHHVDPALVPGILMTNRPLKVEKPSIAEIAPTVLDVFAVPKPAYMEGRVIV